MQIAGRAAEFKLKCAGPAFFVLFSRRQREPLILLQCIARQQEK